MKLKSESEIAQSCRTLSDPMDWNPPGSSIHGIFQARVLEWGAIAFSDSCLGNLMNRGAWWARFHGIEKRHDWATNTNISSIEYHLTCVKDLKFSQILKVLSLSLSFFFSFCVCICMVRYSALLSLVLFVSVNYFWHSWVLPHEMFKSHIMSSKVIGDLDLI